MGVSSSGGNDFSILISSAISAMSGIFLKPLLMLGRIQFLTVHGLTRSVPPRHDGKLILSHQMHQFRLFDIIELQGIHIQKSTATPC